MLKGTGDGLKDKDHDSEDFNNKLGMFSFHSFVPGTDTFYSRDDSFVFSMVGYGACVVVRASQICFWDDHQFIEWN